MQKQLAMAERAFNLTILILLVAILSARFYVVGFGMIPGRGCGAETPITIVKKLTRNKPIRNLKCVLVKDKKSYQTLYRANKLGRITVFLFLSFVSQECMREPSVPRSGRKNQVVYFCHFLPEYELTNPSPCNATCGYGTKTREHICTIGGMEVSSEECGGFQKRLLNLVCYKECPGEKNITICFISSNVCSLPSKLHSLVTCFDELDLSFACLTETWLTKLDDLQPLRDAENIEIISRCRKTRGGGVAIAFDCSKIILKQFPVKGNKFELICVTGKHIANGRNIAIFVIYVPPKQSNKVTEELLMCLADATEEVKRCLSDPLIVITGDMNRRDISPAFLDFDDISKLPLGPTRGQACLDECFTNFNDKISQSIGEEMRNDNGIGASDHKTIICESICPLPSPPEKQTFTF